jgi:para-nitrobenzyl esterase
MEYVGPMGEDCLVLNVWTNRVNDGRKRPVMVWIHGGGFANGSASVSLYDGMELAAKHDVVLVSVNHRLNIFGFLYLADLSEKYAHSGNAGMQDLVLALEWVRDNISNFGGDPGNVTIFGQSGGGSKVSTLLGMPAAKGLFHRAVAMSGSQVTSGRRGDATESTLAVLKRLNLDRARLDDLQNVPVDQLLELTVSGGGVRGLGPVVDGYSLPANAFEPAATDISANVPLMIGSNETEATWNANMNYDPLDESALRNRVKQTLRIDEPAAEHVIAVYRKDRPKASNLDLFLIIASDGSNFRTGTDLQAERKTAQAAAPVYRYYFQWYSPVRQGKLRSMHTMELGFVFDHVGISKSTIGEGKELQPLADKMSAAWVAFARSGNPNHKGLPNWPRFNLDQKPTMVFNNECRLVNNPYGDEKAAIADATRRKQV